MRLILDGALDESPVSELASMVGLGERQLRRLFVDELGASPLSIAKTRRVHFARKLIDETHLDMVDVALTAGFKSVRRFNDCIKTSFGKTPSELRRDHARSERSSESITLLLPYRPPYDWQGTLAFLAPRCLPGIESVAGGRYRRLVCDKDAAGIVEVSNASQRNALVVVVPANLFGSLHALHSRVRSMFDVRADPLVVQDALGDVEPFDSRDLSRGIRVPGCFDGFELGIRAILGQQVSVAHATALTKRLIETHGAVVDVGDDALSRRFPSAADLAKADLASLGVPRQRAAALRRLSEAVSRKDFTLHPTADPSSTRESLLKIPGIGPWTADYILIRALSHPDVLPTGDLVLRKAVSSDGTPVSSRHLEALADSWRPWRAYGAFCLWQGTACGGE